MQVSEVLTPIRKFEPFVRTSTFLLSMLPALSAANAPSPPCCQNVAIDTTEEVQHTNVGNHHSPLHAFDRLSIGDALHKLAWKRVRRYRTAVLLIKNSTHGSELAFVCTNGSNFRIDVKTLPKFASLVPTLYDVAYCQSEFHGSPCQYPRKSTEVPRSMPRTSTKKSSNVHH